MNVCRYCALVVSDWRPLRVACAPVVGSDYAKAVVDKCRDNMAPFPPCLRKSMQEHDRVRSAPSGHIMKTHTRLRISHSMRPVRPVLVLGQWAPLMQDL